MDKLLNISREGGYPLCAETLQVLYDNARAVNVLLAGLNLPNNTAVILGSEDYSSRLEVYYSYLYAVTSNGRRLVRYTQATGKRPLRLQSVRKPRRTGLYAWDNGRKGIKA